MDGRDKIVAQQGIVRHWVLELLLPGLFSFVLLACLAHMACCALQSHCGPVVGFQYAISAFAL